MHRTLMTALAMACALLLAACASAPGTVHQFMEQRGFGGSGVVALIHADGGARNITPDMPAVLEAMKHTTMVSGITVTPSCIIDLNRGSSTPRQNMWVYIAESGDGYVEYMGRKSFFTSPALRGFCASEWARSQPLGLGLPAPGRHFEYYTPVPGEYLDNDFLPLPKSPEQPPGKGAWPP